MLNVRVNAIRFTVDASDQDAQNYRSHFDEMMSEYKEMKENIKKPEHAKIVRDH